MKGTERLLGDYAEPMAGFAAMTGAAYPRGFLDEAWNQLLQNHGHDSIGACSRDVVPHDMFFRYRQANEISTCVMEQAFADIAGVSADRALDWYENRFMPRFIYAIAKRGRRRPGRASC